MYVYDEMSSLDMTTAVFRRHVTKKKPNRPFYKYAEFGTGMTPFE